MPKKSEKTYHPNANNLELVLEQMVNHPEKTYTQMAEDTGLNRSTFDRIKATDEFWEEYHKRNMERFKGLQSEAVTMLRRLVREGNPQMVKYALDNTGYALPEEVNINTPDIRISIGGDDNDGTDGD